MPNLKYKHQWSQPMNDQTKLFILNNFSTEIAKLIELAKPFNAIASKSQRVRLNICLDYLRTTRKEIKEQLHDATTNN